MARYGLPQERPLLPLGLESLDQALGGGLMPGALHEVHAGDWSAGGLAACLAIRAAGGKPVFWVRPDYEALEYGALHAQGWAMSRLATKPTPMMVLTMATIQPSAEMRAARRPVAS